MNKYLLIFFLLGIVFAEPYIRRIGLHDLYITAAEREFKNNEVYFYSSPLQREVVLEYDEVVIYAGQARLRLDDRVFLSDGFRSSYLNNRVSGQTLEYNPRSGFMEGQNIVISTEDLYASSDRLSFQGEKIGLYNLTLGVPMYGFSIRSKQLDLYPGWTVLYDTTFNVGDWPLWYIPVYVTDQRRTAFHMPGSIPEWGRTYFSGDYFRWNSHYYINEKYYGNLQANWTQLKGFGYGIQSIMRFSDRDQMVYVNRNWQNFPTQETFSYEHSFLELPYDDKENIDFVKLWQYSEEIKTAKANSLFLSRTVYQESGENLINREIEAKYRLHYNTLWNNMSLHSVNTYASIYEITTDTHGSRWQSYTELSKGVEIPYFTTIFPGVGYDTVKYSLHPYSWHRVFCFAGGGYRFWIFRWQARVYYYLDERGRSPFSYDTHYAIGDYTQTTATVRLWNLLLGQTVRTVIRTGRVHDMMYFLEYTTRPWIISLEYNYTTQSWYGGLRVLF